MTIDTFTRPISFVLLSLALMIFAWPLPVAHQWSIYSAIAMAVGVIGFARMTGIQTSFTFGSLLLIGACAALKVGYALFEAYILCVTGIAFIGAAVVVALTRIRSNAISNPIQQRHIERKVGVSEYLTGKDIVRKQAQTQPKWIAPSREGNFTKVIGMEDFKRKLFDAGLESRGPNDRNGILLYGEPGDGKTLLAKSLAGELGLEFVAIKTQSSQWVGQETEMVFNQLNEAVTRGFCLIFFDEAETLLGSRRPGETGGKAPEMNALLNGLLTFIADHRRSSVVFVAATNFLNQIDPAMRRPGRFDYIFEVPSPDLPARKGLLLNGFSRNAHGLSIAGDVVESLAKRWDGFSAATILGVTKVAAEYGREKQVTHLSFDDLMAVLRLQQGLACRVPESTKSFTQMVYHHDQSLQIRDLITRMERSFEIEEAGGESPSGVLFYGDAGTGKTETARMIAKESKWAFFPVSGSDLARDPDLITNLMQKVKNARPAIVFIDEADDLIGDRINSPYKAATNKLLEAMDGVNGRMSDLLWIASTNFPEDSDAAVVRSGRFTEKILFKRPENNTLLDHAKNFFADPKRQAVLHVTWDQVSELLEGSTIADAQGILMKAWNFTLTSDGGLNKANPVTMSTLIRAKKAIQGE